MSPRVVLILVNIAVFCTGCVCPGPCYGPAVCRPQACGPVMQAAYAPMAGPMLPRPLLPRPFGNHHQVATAPAFRQVSRFKRDAAEWPEALPMSYSDRSVNRRPKTTCDSSNDHQKLRLTQKTHSRCRCETCSGGHRDSVCSNSSCTHCAPPLPVGGSCVTKPKGQCRCHSCQNHKTVATGCTDCQHVPMLGLPHHQPVFGQSRLPSSAPTKPSPKAQTTPVDVTTDVAPDIMEGKNVDDVVPAPVPPADPPTDPAPVPPPSEQRIDAGEPAPEDPFFPAEEQAAEPLSTEESQKLAPKPVPEIQPIALWIPETRRPVIRPAVKPTRKVEASEIVVLPGTRMSSKRIQ